MRDGRILVVHPEDGSGPIERALEEAGYLVTVVERATTAVARVSSGEFDCVVSGYELPGDDGVALLEAIREVDPTLPKIMYTADDAVADDAFECGIDRFVTRNGAASLDRLIGEVTAVTSETTDPPQDVSDHEPDPEAIVRAIDDAPIGISLSHASLPDDPLVYINDAWEDITGYDRQHALGRNPRFLQGPATDAETVEAIGNAIGNDVPITVEVQNYRRDGTPFWNELTVAPVRDDDGEVTHYVGFQNDVTDRKTAETIVEERTAKLAEERRALRRLLEHVHGLLNEITDVLVTERDRRVIAQRVCDEIATVGTYPACWFGSTTPTGDALVLEASTGLSETVDSQLELTTLPAPVEDVLESGEPGACRVGECTSEILGPATVGARRLAVVPVAYGHKRYGLLGVYGDRGETLDRREQQLFASIGRMVGSRLNAIQTQELLTADRVTEIEVEIRDEQFPLSAVAGELEGPVEYVGLTHTPDSASCELFCTTTADTSSVDLSALAFVDDVRRITDTGAGTTFALTVESASPFRDLAEYGASISELIAHPRRVVLTLELSPSDEVRSILDVLKAQYDQVTLRSRTERETRTRTVLDCSAMLEERLTDRQQAALEAAQLNGYFEWPRPADGAEIAETMGITRQTFHQHLRAAERKLVETYVGTGSNGQVS
ncbi:bacterio-opsin activator domain-containing protein [Natrarchaeobaculum sulfurireducens]|uniref:bacterio-opsin activator domain-containing protein n=1 Tax=Natrarchaeobaculum sulfurireducens TaxID=2044521 RepID=UPI000E3DE74C|nr:bacterio-opsin activator domain-containing protein [Natrarchaeobaculum sulfurireducens]